jgi:hypothetical protein
MQGPLCLCKNHSGRKSQGKDVPSDFLLLAVDGYNRHIFGAMADTGVSSRLARSDSVNYRNVRMLVHQGYAKRRDQTEIAPDHGADDKQIDARKRNKHKHKQIRNRISQRRNVQM